MTNEDRLLDAGRGDRNVELPDRGLDTAERADALALAGHVERDGRAAKIDFVERPENGSPHRPVEGEAGEEHERRSVVGGARIEVPGELAKAQRRRKRLPSSFGPFVTMFRYNVT